jgi:hypothetical protein
MLVVLRLENENYVGQQQYIKKVPKHHALRYSIKPATSNIFIGRKY